MHFQIKENEEKDNIMNLISSFDNQRSSEHSVCTKLQHLKNDEELHRVESKSYKIYLIGEELLLDS